MKGELDMEVKYLISAVSAMHIGVQAARFPGCFFASVQRIIREAGSIGYDGIQALPMRGMIGTEPGIELCEGAWNAVDSLVKALIHGTGAAKVPSCLNDWVVSPDEATCRDIMQELRQRRIPQVCHSLLEWVEATQVDRPALLEVHPGLWLNRVEIARKCQETEGLRLCLDTRHIRRGFSRKELWLKPSRRGQDSPLGGYQSAIETLAPWVDVIHVQPLGPSELGSFAEQSPESTLARMLRRALWAIHDVAPDRDLVLVAEYNPGIGRFIRPWQSRELAAVYLAAMKGVVSTV